MARVLVGESALVVGWIPAFQEREQVPNGFLADVWERDPSVPLLLRSGNAAPPAAFSGPGDLNRYLGLHDFRGALAIDQPTLSVGRDGLPVSIEFLALAQTGATVIRSGSGRLQYRMSGIGSTSGEIAEEEGRVLIRLFLRMKLGLWGQIAAKVMTTHWPPWATLMVEYEFLLDDYNPRARIGWSGTTVPSQTRYVGWKRASQYSIEENLTEAAYEGFVQAGGCFDATARRTELVIPVREAKNVFRENG